MNWVSSVEDGIIFTSSDVLPSKLQAGSFANFSSFGRSDSAKYASFDKIVTAWRATVHRPPLTQLCVQVSIAHGALLKMFSISSSGWSCAWYAANARRITWAPKRLASAVDDGSPTKWTTPASSGLYPVGSCPLSNTLMQSAMALPLNLSLDTWSTQSALTSNKPVAAWATFDHSASVWPIANLALRALPNLVPHHAQSEIGLAMTTALVVVVECVKPWVIMYCIAFTSSAVGVPLVSTSAIPLNAGGRWDIFNVTAALSISSKMTATTSVLTASISWSTPMSRVFSSRFAYCFTGMDVPFFILVMSPVATTPAATGSLTGPVVSSSAAPGVALPQLGRVPTTGGAPSVA